MNFERKIEELTKNTNLEYVIEDIVNKDDAQYIFLKIKKNPDQIDLKILCESIENKLGAGVKIVATQDVEAPKNKVEKIKIPGIKKTIVVCSGKGGVGKSTVSANIALHFSKIGFKVGLLDTDIYGPSIHHMFDLSGEPKMSDDKFIPHIKNNIKIMSMGFLIDSDDALMWRGPMISKMLYQLIMKTDWYNKNFIGMKSGLDYLIIDTPPGTGDVHISLIQKYQIDGAVIVSTPQKLAISNAHRSLVMLQKLGVPIIGIVENMAYLIDKNDNKNFIFGEGNIEKYSAELDIELLASIPILEELSKSADNWENSVVFENLCNKIINKINNGTKKVDYS